MLVRALFILKTIIITLSIGENMKNKHLLLFTVLILFLSPVIVSGAWTPMTSGTTNNLWGVWGSSGSDVFAVGDNGTILHYNGSAWSSIENPLNGTNTTLRDVWGNSGNDVFVVGYNGIILHYNGSNWSSMSSGAGILFSVWGSSGSDVFAVGTSGTIVHYNGSNWSSMSSGATGFLFGVWGSSGSDVFITGTSGILHYDGSSWSSMSSGHSFLNAWGSSGSDVFAVGLSSVIPHYNGSSWSSMSSGTTELLYNVWGSCSSDVFIVGEHGTILHYNGSNWSSMSSVTTRHLNDVWGSSGSDVFAVGDNGTILHYAGASTVIELSSFTATPKAGKVLLQWSTESETDNAGFNIYRSTSENGQYIKINTSLIPSQGSSTQGASYEFTDTAVQNRKTYYYKLEDIDLNGTSTMHGSVSATPRLIYGIGK
jgi:hypothetical protein